MSRPSQLTSALAALSSRNTSNFNERYSIRSVGSPPPSRPSSPFLSISRPPSRENSQFEQAKRALSSNSPKEFNVKYGYSTKARKTRKYRRAARKSRRSTRSRR